MPTSETDAANLSSAAFRGMSGGNQFGIDEPRGVKDSKERVFGARNVYVADSSLFPAAPSVNPYWMIMPRARRAALNILDGGL